MKKLGIGLGLAGVAYMFMQPKRDEEQEQTATDTTTDVTTTVVVPVDTPVTPRANTNDKGIEGVEQNGAYWQERLSAGETIEDLWAEWNDVSNKMLPFLPTLEAFTLAVLMLPSNTFIAAPSGSWDGTPIRYNSTPVHATWSRWWRGEYYWGLDQWMQFHQALEAHFGDTLQANNMFMQHWSHNDNSLCDATWGVGCWRCDATSYFNSKGLNIMTYGATTACGLRNSGSAIITNTAQAAANTTQIVVTTTEAGINAAESIKDMGKYLPYAAAAVALIILTK